MKQTRKKRVHYINIAWKCTFCDPEMNYKIQTGENQTIFSTGFMQSKFINKYIKGESESIFCNKCGRLIGNYYFEKHGGFCETNKKRNV